MSLDADATAAEADEPVLAVDDLRHAYSDVTVLSGVSFDLAPGAVTAVVGPNGSGKTTLLRAVAGLLDPDQGSVARPTGAPRSVGYLPQHPGFRPAFTVAETLRFYGDLVGEEGVADRLAAVGLGDAADRRVDALSGGMVRLLALAQATLGDPPLVVLDEPTSDLDPAMTGHIFDVVADLPADDCAVLLATHDLAAVESAADRVLLLDGGEIVAAGSPADLRAETGTDSLTAAFSALVGDGLTVRTGGDGA